MTPQQEARLLGFNASLQQRGVLLKVRPAETQVFYGLLEPVSASGGDRFAAEREATRIHVLRTIINAFNLKPGMVLNQYDGARAVAGHRIVAIEDNRANIAVVLTCETVEK
jgi:hypothetical protein